MYVFYGSHLVLSAAETAHVRYRPQASPPMSLASELASVVFVLVDVVGYMIAFALKFALALTIFAGFVVSIISRWFGHNFFRSVSQ